MGTFGTLSSLRGADQATSGSHDLEGLTRPLLEALAKLANLESTYLTIFFWERHEQQVVFVHSSGETQVREGLTLPLPLGFSPLAFPGVTRSPLAMDRASPDGVVARRLGLKSFVSVPVIVAEHRLFGMLCGAGSKPRQLGEQVVSVMESFARIIADHVIRQDAEEARRRAEEAEELLRTRALFLAMAEHELKTPLSGLTGMAKTLLNLWGRVTEAERLELLDAVVQNAGKLESLLDDLLVKARADVRANEVAREPVEIASLLQRIGREFGYVSSKHEVVAEAEDGVTALGDPALLYQVLGHLVDNAIKYSPDGGAIRLRGEATPEGVRLEITDQGLGLPADVDIFEPFRQAEPGEAKGVGLGLHIVRTLLEAMDGSVTARPNPNRGATFTVLLPPAP